MQFLPADEAATITRHLERCDECRDELARVHGDLAAYASTVDLQSPPAAARQRLIQQVAREKKIVASPQPGQSRKLRRMRPSPPLAAAAPSSPIEDHPPKRPGPLLPRLVGWAVAAGLAVAAAFLYQDRATLRANLSLPGRSDPAPQHRRRPAHQLMDALTDPKAVRVTLTTKPQPKAAAPRRRHLQPRQRHARLPRQRPRPAPGAQDLRALGHPRRRQRPIPAGTFHPDDHGNASVIMPNLPKGVAAKAFGVTIEPDGGSQTPTLPIILAGS